MAIKYNSQEIIKGNQKVWFLNGNLVKIYHSNRSTGTMTLYNITTNAFEYCLKSDFIKHRERAYSLAQTAKLINRHRKYLPNLIKRGIIPPPIGAQPGGGRGWQIRAYYSETTIKEIRNILSNIHIGRPRKDGLSTNNVTPTSQELTHSMGDGILLYTKTSDGRYIPIWNESI